MRKGYGIGKYAPACWVLMAGMLWGVLVPLNASAQDCGQAKLEEAARQYDIGKFDEVVSLLTPCLEKGFTEREKVEGYRLMALTYLGQDDVEKSRAATENLLLYDPLYEPSIYDPAAFVNQVKAIRSGKITVQITSVSKKAEDPLKAPATVMIVTREQIRQRGYNDLMAVLHDLPGFDISMIYGVTYGNIYQRGFRSNNTERTLIMVDGVEENNFWSNIAYFSRQYPVSNVERIEVIYGPASTMYGPNAYIGVVNIITRKATDIIKENRNIGISAEMAYGSYNTQSADVTVAARKNNISLTVTGRYFRSDEMDLTSDSLFDYNKNDFNDIDYGGLLNVGSGADAFLADNGLPLNHPYYTVGYGADSIPQSLTLTAAGDSAATAIDRASYDALFNGEPIGFSNITQDWLINAKLKISEFTLGFQTWRREEGSTTHFTDMNEAGYNNGSQWIPVQTFLYARYEKQLSDNLTLTSHTDYRIHGTNDNSRAAFAISYANGLRNLAALANDRSSAWVHENFYQSSKQLRSELKAVYTPSSKIDIVGGLEYRSSQQQGDYLRFTSNNVQDSATLSGNATFGANQFNHRDMSVYGQGSYMALDNLKIFLGARVDNNKIRRTGGFGTEVSPRVAVVYYPGKFIFKGIYSRGIQNVPNRTKFSVSDIRIPNPTLDTESIRNFEISASCKITKEWFADVAAYRSDLEGLVATRPDPNVAGKVSNQNIGSGTIMGLQANVAYTKDRYTGYLNYTFTDPENQEDDESDPVRIGDIASHQINAGINAVFLDNLNVNLRMNFVGERQTGEGTSVPANPDDFPAYAIFNATVSYNDLLTPGLSLQVMGNNLLDNRYWHPGPRSASSFFYTSRVLQRDRNFMVKLNYDF